MSAGQITQGRRAADVPDGANFHLNPGEYCRISKIWFACTPNDNLGNLANHTVTEHEDGTITVSPSILVSEAHGPVWHGYLERGIWREV